ncbi:hypothetical protein EW146_g6158 [Bondarzewia mesenterica]|uniref:DUF6534 domain-containing protein n=1 Tax=Bondarzewia mesenterica TaxID=1095465 RepID=A0A4V3XEL8_9AGAM|nr:hypothetical protein EW146_g6158 [Bondarzewia mesenterica]
MDESISLQSTQAAFYAGNYLAAVDYPDDLREIKIMVAALWIIDTMHSILSSYGVYQVFLTVEKKARCSMSMSTSRAITATVLLTCVSDTSIRCFYCHRIWKLSNRDWFLTATGLVSVIVSFCKFSEYVGFILHLSAILYCSLGSVCIADWIITLITSILLWRKHSPIKRTNSTINTLILYTVTTGLLTSILALTILIVYITIPGYPFVGIQLNLSKLYFNSFLATLNIRQSLKHNSGRNGMITMPVSSFGERGQSFRTNDMNHQDIVIIIETESSNKIDPSPATIPAQVLKPVPDTS